MLRRAVWWNFIDVSEVLAASIIRAMKIAVFWEVAPCSPVDIERCFGGAYCLHHQGDVG
jgi:hypothetical protein